MRHGSKIDPPNRFEKVHQEADYEHSEWDQEYQRAVSDQHALHVVGKVRLRHVMATAGIEYKDHRVLPGEQPQPPAMFDFELLTVLAETEIRKWLAATATDLCFVGHVDGFFADRQMRVPLMARKR
jgi:hypothetical protein